jgi:hypothetical protein
MIVIVILYIVIYHFTVWILLKIYVAQDLTLNN